MQALPGFGGANNSPNWTVVGTKKLDTSSYGGEYLAFWVFVYIKDPNGKLVAEIPDRGLTGLPTLQRASDLQTHGNNVGFYKQLLYFPPSSNAPATVELSQAGISVSDLTVTPSRIELGQDGVIAAEAPISREALPTAQGTVFLDGLTATQKLIAQTTGNGLPNGISSSLMAKLRAASNVFFPGKTRWVIPGADLTAHCL